MTLAPSANTGFSWWLLLLPAIGISAAAFFAYIMFVTIPSEMYVLHNGVEANAEINRVWHETSRDAKGRKRTSHFADLTWQDQKGLPHRFERLFIGQDAYRELDAAKSAGKTTLIRYDSLGHYPTPFLLADRAHRESDWGFAKWGVIGFGLFALWGVWLMRRAWIKSRNESLAAG